LNNVRISPGSIVPKLRAMLSNFDGRIYKDPRNGKEKMTEKGA